jgi:hypothetical protein
LGRARLELAHCAAQVVQLTLVFNLLPLGQFQGLQHLIQVLNHFLQHLDDRIYILDRLGHGGPLTARLRGRGRGSLRALFTGPNRRFATGCRRLDRGRRRILIQVAFSRDRRLAFGLRHRLMPRHGTSFTVRRSVGFQLCIFRLSWVSDNGHVLITGLRA